MTNRSNAQWEEPSDPEISIGAMLDVPAADPGDVLGERFGKYLIVGELAMGGMAEVFLGVQRGLENFFKVVVIKRVLPQYATNTDFVRMFIDEARLAARLEHPNIVRTYEFGEVDGQYFTAMEYLPGEDLTKVLNTLGSSRQKMPLHLAAGIVSNICAGLHFAHQLTDMSGLPLNLVHRDVNPANVIITYGGEVKVIDWGVAKTNDGQKTVAGTIKGKLAYMAPEQLLGRGVDQRSDVFSTGVVLWELLTGRPLFVRDSEAATLYAIMNDPIAVPSRYRSDVPAALDDIVMRALARTPADRFDSAEDMRDALDRFLESQPKYDTRVVARMLVDVFGRTRAEAKKSIAQTRSLSQNISLVMKLRSEVRSDLAERLESLGSGEHHPRASQVAMTSAEPPRRFPIVWALAILVCIAGGLGYVLVGSGSGSTQEARAAKPTAGTMQIESSPPGAAISIGGEPTGLVTPATVSGVTASELVVRLERPGFATMSQTITVPEGGTVTKHFTLAPDTQN